VNDSVVATEVLGAMITPAVLISASGTLVLSTSNRLTRVVDRVRVLADEALGLHQHEPDDAGTHERKRSLIEDQLTRLSQRALLLRTALSTLYLAIGLLVATSISIGLVALVEWRYGWVPVALGLAGASALLVASLMLIREARLAVGSTLREMEFVRQVVGRRR
jgi:Protein of unknown function (DUF2721)